jgi:hypothetical protein
MREGIEFLREKRGSERVTFSDVCDHLTDYAERHPETAEAIEDFARFVAAVEEIEHDHERATFRGMAPDQDMPH